MTTIYFYFYVHKKRVPRETLCVNWMGWGEGMGPPPPLERVAGWGRWTCLEAAY